MTPIDPFFLSGASDNPDGDQPDRPDPCPDCAYDLRSTPRGQPCPECGWLAHKVINEDEGTPCKKCGTRVPNMVLGALCHACAEKLPGVDRTCGKCGYDLTGLGGQPRCPECGYLPMESDSLFVGMRTLPELPESFQRSLQWQLGLLLLCFSTGGWALAVVIRTLGAMDSQTWLVCLLVVSISIAATGWLVTPGRLDGKAKWFVPVRWTTRLLVLAWPMACLPGASTVMITVLAAVGLLGYALLLWVLAMLARTGDRLFASRRFELGWIWALPCGALAWVLPFPGGVANLPQNQMGYVFMFFTLIMLVPSVGLFWFAFRGSLMLFREGQWSVANIQHAERLQKAKTASTCTHCGYDMRGQDPHAQCPECGHCMP
jgi:hypothetical protein